MNRKKPWQQGFLYSREIMKNENKIDDPTNDIDFDLQTKKTKKKKWMLGLTISVSVLILIIIILLFFLLRACNTTTQQQTKLQIVIDPLIITGSGENHLNNGQVIVFGEDDESKEYNTHIQTRLNSGQVMEYRYSFVNSGETNIATKLELTLVDQENMWITYSIDGVEQQYDEKVLFDKTLTNGDKMNVKICIRVANEDYDAFATGVFTLTLEERGTK